MSKTLQHILFLLLTIILFAPSLSYAENGQIDKCDLAILSRNDSLIEKYKNTTDTLPEEYQKLKKESARYAWSKSLYRLMIKEPRVQKADEAPTQSAEEFAPYQGKIIRNINITVLPPFGTKISDPAYEKEDLKLLNSSHILTKSSTIRSILQFKKNNKVNPALIMASEADLRSARHIYDARINIDTITNCSDSVDVEIIVRDKWTIGLEIHNLSTSRTNIEIFDANILGSGSRAGLSFIYSDKYKRKFGYGLNYLYRNIAKTGINAEGEYIDKIDSYRLSLSAIRHLQPKYKYFGETSYFRKVDRSHIVTGWDSISPDRYETVSFTLGRAFTLPSQSSIKQFVLALRYKSQYASYYHPDHSAYMKDKLLPYKYTGSKTLLLEASLYSNYYEQEYMVYNIGTTEDIALGYNISTQIGYAHAGLFHDAFYNSVSASYGTNKILPGNIYLSSSLGSFFKSQKPFGGILKMEAKYFTPIKQVSTMHYRQFVSILYSKLLHPDRYLSEYIYMGEYTSLRMRDWYRGSKGIQQLLIKSETDLFTNIQLSGFRFLFYNFIDIGWITPQGKLFASDNFNYGFGFGVRLRNNFIIFNTIDIKIGYYPKLKQDSFGSFFKVRSSSPEVSPNFIPKFPEVIEP